MIINAEDWLRPALKSDQNIELVVSDILNDIQSNGDLAIEKYAEQFDGQPPKSIELQPFEAYALEPKLAKSIQLAAQRIEAFAKFQYASTESKEYKDDFGYFGQVVTPIETIGAYIPGGRYPLISTALMTLIPARVAGCKERIAVSPSDHPAILAAASLAGATQFYQMGGVQAIGALAFGYKNISPVSLVVGPGNAWVNEAKKQVQSTVKIDGLAGPSELLAVCDKKQPIDWLALDALAQAEHDPMACSLLVSDSREWLEGMLQYLQSNEDTTKLLHDEQIALIHASDKDALINFSDAYAPEHLMLCHDDIAPADLKNYGSLFVGANSAVALGDYISGPNHTLPTLGYSKQTGGLSVLTYLKVATVQSINERGRIELCDAAKSIADAEGLKFHAQSLAVRAKK